MLFRLCPVAGSGPLAPAPGPAAGATAVAAAVVSPFGAEAAVPNPTARRPLGKSPQPDPTLAPEKMAVAPGAALRRNAESISAYCYGHQQRRD